MDNVYTTQTCSIFFGIEIDLQRVYEEWACDATLELAKYQGNERDCAGTRAVGRTFFWNACTLLLRRDDHRINAKVSKNGTVQLTGCRRETDARFVFFWMWEKMGSVDTRGVVVWSMTNYNETIPHVADRAALVQVLRSARFDLILMCEPSYHYSGIFFKVPCSAEDVASQSILRIDCLNGIAREYTDSYGDFVVAKPRLSTRYVSFTLFPSGKCNVSGLGPLLTRLKIAQVKELLRKGGGGGGGGE
jgi:hypothetical protein